VVIVQLLSPRDAGRLLGVCTERVQQLDREGQLHALRDSAGRRFFRKQDVLRLKAEREQAKQHAQNRQRAARAEQ
jgi:DNA-binding transcriptional MerR regulator